ncbi:MAG: hypothetical protein RL095_1788 [Verrucomicrobiota bacterium]|jgi:hypothetical protein
MELKQGMRKLGKSNPKSTTSLPAASEEKDSLGHTHAYRLRTEPGLGGARRPVEPGKPSCPNCESGMEAKEVICVHCGYDTRTQQVLEMKAPGIPGFTGPQFYLKSGEPKTRMWLLVPLLLILIGLLCWMGWQMMTK